MSDKMTRIAVGNEFSVVLGNPTVIPDRAKCNMWPCMPDAHIVSYPIEDSHHLHPSRSALTLLPAISNLNRDRGSESPGKATALAKVCNALEQVQNGLGGRSELFYDWRHGLP